jgi:flagellin-like protein
MRGVSPFIATILLIAMAVTVGGVIVAWYTGLLGLQAGLVEEEAMSEIECLGGAILIHDATIRCDVSRPGTTADPDLLNFTVENTGRINLWNLRAQLYVADRTWGPYEMVDLAEGKLFTRDWPLRPGYKRTVWVNLTENIITGDAEWISIITQCPGVGDKVEAIDCTP